MSEKRKKKRKEWVEAYILGKAARTIDIAINPYGRGDLNRMCAWAAGYFNY